MYASSSEDINSLEKDIKNHDLLIKFPFSKHEGLLLVFAISWKVQEGLNKDKDKIFLDFEATICNFPHVLTTDQSTCTLQLFKKMDSENVDSEWSVRCQHSSSYLAKLKSWE